MTKLIERLLRHTDPRSWQAKRGAVRKLRARGDRLRDARRWTEAAACYRQYLASVPDDHAIMVQLGHCLKEAGDPAAALELYRTARTLCAADADIVVQIGHALRLIGREAEARAHYTDALALDPGCIAAERELTAAGAASSPMTANEPTSVVAATPELTIVSFFGGDQYYYEAADRLRADCNRIGLRHDIAEVHRRPGEDWADLCRRKIPFMRDMLTKHGDGVVWIDVDNTLLRDPRPLLAGAHDMSLFLRNFNSLRDFDPTVSTRTFAPAFIHLNGTDAARDFIAHAAHLEETSTLKATDDYYLEEAWRTFEGSLDLLLLDPVNIARNPGAVSDRTLVLFGHSGNVKSFIGNVEQHTVRRSAAARQARELRIFGDEALRAQDRHVATAFYAKAHQIDPKNRVSALRYARQLLVREEPAGTIEVLKRAFGAQFRGVEEARLFVEAAMRLGERKRAHKMLDTMANIAPDLAGTYVAARRFALSLDDRAEELGIADAARTPLWWMDTPHPGNLGDIVNPYIVERLSGIPPRRVNPGDGVLAVGSVIKFAREGTIVWGTGTPRMTDALAPRAEYRAVRGPLTRELVLKSGGRCPEVYGDPALLLPLLHPPVRSKTHRLGLILHHTHASVPVDVDEDVRRIDIMRIGYDQIEAFLDELTACEAILSTSLHGLIIAHAYGIPTRWCTVSSASKQIAGDGTKFHDHAAALGIAIEEPLDLSSIERIHTGMAALCVEYPVRTPDLKALLDAAPFPVHLGEASAA